MVRYLMPHQAGKRRRWTHRSPREIFSEIYRDGLWGHDESRSGGGSTLAATENVRRELPGVLADLGARSMLDAPCGDFYWMSRVDLGIERYIGADIVPELIEALTRKHARDGRSFMQLDLASDPLPEVDVLFCRDCLQHLARELGMRVIDNFRRSSCRYLITTTFPDVRFNPDGFTGGTNTLNLCLAPFNLPAPMREIIDHGSHDDVYRRVLGVWSREQVRQAG